MESGRNQTATARGQTFRFGDLAFRTVVASGFSSAVSLFEVELGPGCLSGPLHVHAYEDGISYVLEGELSFQVGDSLFRASPGERVALPRGVPHTFWNAGRDPARALDVVTPGGLEHYYEELAHVAGALDVMDRLAAMEERFGVTMDWDSVPELLERHGLRMAAS
jgi:uncharacterized cupin superfamily protein